MPFDLWLLGGRRRRARIDGLLDRLDRAAAAAEDERGRLEEAVAVAHRALRVLHDRLEGLAEQPARAEAHARALVDRAETELRAAAAGIGDRIAAEVAPARAAAEEHAAYLRASLDRLRGETEALGGAREAASVLVAMSGTAQAGFADALAAFSARSERAADAADRAVARLEAAADRVARPPTASRRRAAAG